MYTPAHFSEGDGARTASIIRRHAFATLISVAGEELQVTHGPVMFEPDWGAKGRLIGHLARANPHATHLVDGASVLAIFHGPHCYISPTWYRDENPRVPNVPTWNYAVVHVHGKVKRIDDVAQKWKIVTDLATEYERGSEKPWDPQALATHASKLDAIVGFELAIDRVEAKSKLSQNRSVADQENVIAQLEAGSFAEGLGVAQLMHENLAAKAKS